MKPITTPQPKWHGHAQDSNKTTINHNKAPKYQKHKTSNKHHDSIPMVLKETQLEPSLGFHGNLSLP